MKFSGPVNPSAQKQIQEADKLLCDPARLQTLADTGLMDSPSEEAFDRLARLAAKVLKAPLTIVSLVSDQKQFFKASYGMPSPMDVTREIPIEGSICRYTSKGVEIIADNAATDPLLEHHPATGPWGIGAFIAIPMIMPNGHVLGAFCAVDTTERHWSELDIEIMRELTSSVMTEIRLRDQISKLNLETSMRETFIATLTHDLRTPLSAAKISAQLMARKFPDMADVQKLSSRIDLNLNRADGMIGNLLDAHLLTAGQTIPLHRSNFGLVSRTVALIDELSEVHGNRFQFETPDEILGWWDAFAYRRILENLVSNAVKYGEPGKPITISIERNDTSVSVRIHNLGPVIAKEDQNKIFNAFHRTSSAVQGNQRGWGLGLPLVRGLAVSHGGEVSIQSAEGQGTSFTVTLPIDSRL